MLAGGGCKPRRATGCGELRAGSRRWAGDVVRSTSVRAVRYAMAIGDCRAGCAAVAALSPSTEWLRPVMSTASSPTTCWDIPVPLEKVRTGEAFASVGTVLVLGVGGREPTLPRARRLAAAKRWPPSCVTSLAALGERLGATLGGPNLS